MEQNKSSNQNFQNTEERIHMPNQNGRVLGGIVIVLVGTLLLARQAGADIPHWVFSWEMILIGIGIYIGFRHSFRDFGWLIPVAIGVVFLLDDFYDISMARYFWPVIIIGIGLFMMLKPNRRRPFQKKDIGPITSHDDSLDVVTIFGGVKKIIISKNFHGGEALTIFGGTELDLKLADINGPAEIELTQVFGGTKLIVPPHWKVRTDSLVNIFGGVEDKRALAADTLTDPNKVLTIKGTCIFGGIDLRNY